jgi:hypothetical protein
LPGNVTIPGVPTTGDLCLERVSKIGEGKRSTDYTHEYKCEPRGIATKRGRTIIELTLKGNDECDEDARALPNGSVLRATGNTIRRDDGFAHFFGRFTIIGRAGVTGQFETLFRGIIEIIDRIGTHHPPLGGASEECSQKEHLEGWIVGRGVGPSGRFTLRALIVANAELPAQGGSSPINDANIDGVLIRS